MSLCIYFLEKQGFLLTQTLLILSTPRVLGQFSLRWNSNHPTCKNFSPPHPYRGHIKSPSINQSIHNNQHPLPALQTRKHRILHSFLQALLSCRSSWVPPWILGRAGPLLFSPEVHFPPFSQALAAPVWILLLAFRRVSAPCHTGWERFLPQGTEHRDWLREQQVFKNIKNTGRWGLQLSLSRSWCRNRAHLLLSSREQHWWRVSPLA